MRAVLVVRELGERDLAPEVGGEEGVGLRDLRAYVRQLPAKITKSRRTLTAAKVAFKKLPIVAVEPFDCV